MAIGHYRAEQNDAFIEKSIQPLCVSVTSCCNAIISPTLIFVIIRIVIVICQLYNNNNNSFSSLFFRTTKGNLSKPVLER